MAVNNPDASYSNNSHNAKKGIKDFVSEPLLKVTELHYPYENDLIPEEGS
jgi:hypothetical protein